MAESWWSKRFVEVLESYGLGGRMERGRRYARTGQVVGIDVTAGLLAAQVQGSRQTPYSVSLRVALPDEDQWSSLDQTIRSQVRFAARLLAGEVPSELEAACDDVGIELFPATWSSLEASCSCPDWGNPCKHIAAVLYVFADQLDSDPWLLLAWRGRSREQLLGYLTEGRPTASSTGRSDGLPAWWPLTPGRGPRQSRAAGRWSTPVAVPPDPPDRVLSRLEPLDVEVAGTRLTDLLRAAYGALVADP
jgi:uncharacterized Zn finger protein